jgi:hypothetical protein
MSYLSLVLGNLGKAQTVTSNESLISFVDFDVSSSTLIPVARDENTTTHPTRLLFRLLVNTSLKPFHHGFGTYHQVC